jgi:nicotinate-nucleotide adenylyltransferase
MGSDSLQNISRWKNYELLLKNYTIYIYPRPGADKTEEFPKASLIRIDAPNLEISSTQIRKNLKEGKSIRYLVPENVREEIEKNGYYKT